MKTTYARTHLAKESAGPCQCPPLILLRALRTTGLPSATFLSTIGRCPINRDTSARTSRRNTAWMKCLTKRSSSYQPLSKGEMKGLAGRREGQRDWAACRSSWAAPNDTPSPWRLTRWWYLKGLHLRRPSRLTGLDVAVMESLKSRARQTPGRVESIA